MQVEDEIRRFGWYGCIVRRAILALDDVSAVDVRTVNLKTGR